MTAEIEISEAAEEEIGQRGHRIRPVFGYYRMPNGEVQVALTDPDSRRNYLDEGWDELPRYGYFDMVDTYTISHPFEALFMKGGAKEMLVSQVLENGWHITPPKVPGCGRPINQNHKRHTVETGCFDTLIPVKFPQLSGVDAQPYPCSFCSKILPTEHARGNHEEAMHSERQGDSRSAEALAAALLKGLTPTKAATPSADPLAVLRGLHLTRKQREQLSEAGYTLPEEDPNGDEA